MGGFYVVFRSNSQIFLVTLIVNDVGGVVSL